MKGKKADHKYLFRVIFYRTINTVYQKLNKNIIVRSEKKTTLY